MDATANTKLYYKDINSLYPHVSMTSPYVTGKPLVVVGGNVRNFEWHGNKGVSTSKHRLSSSKGLRLIGFIDFVNAFLL